MNKKGKLLFEKKYPKQMGVGVLAFIAATNMLVLGMLYPVKSLLGFMSAILFLYFIGFVMIFGLWITPLCLYENGMEIPFSLLRKRVMRIDSFIPYSKINRIFPYRQTYSRGWNKDIFSKGISGFVGQKIALGLLTKDNTRHIVFLSTQEREKVLSILKNIYGVKWDEIYLKEDPYSDYREENEIERSEF